jgi:hypothetical protein|tara:strand:- start:1020 stop:1283 length:264 start_codon:yes stop_codon:yes gene_type:complete
MTYDSMEVSDRLILKLFKLHPNVNKKVGDMKTTALITASQIEDDNRSLRMIKYLHHYSIKSTTPNFCKLKIELTDELNCSALHYSAI